MNFRINEKEWSANLWSRIKALFTGLDTRVTALEQGGGGGGGGGGVNVIESISLNGTNVPPDANKNVALAESDPTVPAWAKAASKPAYTATEVGALPDTTQFVSGVKGNAESAYRTGNVNITPANIGAVADSDIIGISHGGTGASSIGTALTNLGVSFYVTSTTWPGVFATLSKIPTGRVSTCYLSSDAAKLLSGNKTATSTYYGSMTKSTNGDFFFHITAHTGIYQYAWRITGFTSADVTPTVDTVYRYTGTAI